MEAEFADSACHKKPRHPSKKLCGQRNIKVPLLCVMKIHIFGFGSPQHQVYKIKKHFNFLTIWFIFTSLAQRIQNDSLNDSFCFKPLLRGPLICGDWSDWSIPFKAVFVGSLWTALPGKQLFLTPQKQHLKWVGNVLMFHVDVNMQLLGIRFKNDSFQWFRADSFFWETITLYTVHFQI